MAAHGLKLSLPARVVAALPVALFLTLTLGRACVFAYVNAHLAQAAREGRSEQINCWLARGADINAQDAFGDTPLMIAARHAHPGVAQILLARGADANMRDHFGLTARHWAFFHLRDSRAVRCPDGIAIRQVPRQDAMQTLALLTR